MAELKTRPTGASVDAFLAAVPDERRGADCRVVLEMMQRVTGAPPEMWGPSIVGFGRYRYEYASGQSAEWPLTGFSPRKQDLTLYIMPGFERYEGLMARLGKHRTGKSCLYLKRLADVDLAVLEELVATSVARARAKYP
jgi:hypothetical protein